jgi:hypothetical protein
MEEHVYTRRRTAAGLENFKMLLQFYINIQHFDAVKCLKYSNKHC